LPVIRVEGKEIRIMLDVIEGQGQPFVYALGEERGLALK
jgi:hypothetical protein